jgi:hypothetical protein
MATHVNVYVIRYRCYLSRSTGCNARLKWEKGEFSFSGDSHLTYHENQKVFIANTELENAVKERCIKQHMPIQDIFDDERSKYRF